MSIISSYGEIVMSEIVDITNVTSIADQSGTLIISGSKGKYTLSKCQMLCSTLSTISMSNYLMNQNIFILFFFSEKKSWASR